MMWLWLLWLLVCVIISVYTVVLFHCFCAIVYTVYTVYILPFTCLFGCLVMPLYPPPIPPFCVFLETDLVVGRASAASRSSLAKTGVRPRVLVYIC